MLDVNKLLILSRLSGWWNGWRWTNRKETETTTNNQSVHFICSKLVSSLLLSMGTRRFVCSCDCPHVSRPFNSTCWDRSSSRVPRHYSYCHIDCLCPTTLFTRARQQQAAQELFNLKSRSGVLCGIDAFNVENSLCAWECFTKRWRIFGREKGEWTLLKEPAKKATDRKGVDSTEPRGHGSGWMHLMTGRISWIKTVCLSPEWRIKRLTRLPRRLSKDKPYFVVFCDLRLMCRSCYKK